MEIPEKYKPEISKLYDEIEKLQSQCKVAFDKKDVDTFIKLDAEIEAKRVRLEEITKEYTREVMGW